MNERELIQALLDGPRNERDLPGTPLERQELARSLRMGGVPVLSWGGGVFALTPAGYDYAEQKYHLTIEPDPDLKQTLDSLQAAGDAVSTAGGDLMEVLRHLLRCIAIGFALSAILYGTMAWAGKWPL